MPRTLTLFIAALCCVGSAFAQNNKRIEMTTGYNAAMPQGDLGQHSATVHAANLRFGYMVPATAGRANIGIELNTGNYASYTKKQMFGFNGTQTLTDVDYTSSVTSTNVGIRYDLLRSNGVSVFGGLKGGFSYFSSDLTVQDPEDEDGCHPMDTRNLIEDFAAQAGVETGVNLDFNRIFTRMPENTLLLQFHTSFIAGGRVDYINVDKQEQATQPTHHAPEDEDDAPILMRFVNTSTGEQHEHEVARQHTSPIRYWEAGVSLVVRL